MHKIKRTSKISLWVFAIFIPLSLFSTTEPKLADSSYTSTGSVYEIDGHVIYHRGAKVSIFGYNQYLLDASKPFTLYIAGSSVSSTQVLNELISDETLNKNLQWSINWDAMILGYIPIWLVVGFFVWLCGDKHTKPDKTSAQ